MKVSQGGINKFMGNKSSRIRDIHRIASPPNKFLDHLHRLTLWNSIVVKYPHAREERRRGLYVVWREAV